MTALPSKLAETMTRYQGEVPVPVVRIASDLGVRIYETDDLAPDEVAVMRKEEEGVVLYLNASHGLVRQRFALAQAIARMSLHRETLTEEEDLVELVDQPLRRREEALEILLPEAEFSAAWKRLASVEELAEAFEVPVGAVVARGEMLFTVVRI